VVRRTVKCWRSSSSKIACSSLRAFDMSSPRVKLLPTGAYGP
jgi:hypothetical protein